MSIDRAILNFFTGKGYPDEVARGIAAGIFAETANDHTAKNDAGGGKGAFGLGQWRGARLDALRKRFGSNPTKAQQLEFLHSELQGGDSGGPKVLAQKNAAGTLRSYINDFMRPAKGAETSGDMSRGRQALGLAKGGDRTSRSAGSTYDRVAPSQDTGPSIAKVYEAYRTGKMDPRDAAQFEHDVQTGAIMLPRKGTLRKTPAAPTLPAGVVKAYNSREMTDEDRAQVDADLREGTVSLPRGVKLKAPAPLSTLENMGMGVRGIMNAAGTLGDIVSSPVRLVASSLGADVNPNGLRDLATQGADALSLATPESESEQLGNAIVEGGTQGLLTAGLAAPLAGASGMTGMVARGLASSPILDTVSGATSGASSETARQAGAGPVGQFAAGLVGGGAPIAAAEGSARVAARIGRRAGTPVAEVVADVPREALIEPSGRLTDDGAEFAAQNGITPKELREAYDGTPPPPDMPVANDAAPRESVGKAVGDDLPLERIESAPPMRAEPDLPTAVQETQSAPDAINPATEQTAPIATADNIPETALARVQEGQELGIDYSRGQATKDFDIQDRESRLRNSNGPEAETMRQFVAKQQGQVKTAVDNLKSAFADDVANATDRGALVKEAVRGLRDAGRAGVTRLYNAAAELGGDNLGLLSNDIRDRAQDVLIDELVDPKVKRALEQQLGRYGLVGKAEKPNELGITKIALDKGSPIEIRGDVRPLTVANAEEFRQALNKMYRDDTSGSLGPVKAALDDAVEEALETAATRGEQAGPVGEAYKTARAAHAEQKKTFASKDVIDQTIAWKKGAENVTEAINPEAVFSKIFAGGKEGTTNLQKMKAVLLSKRTPKSVAAWRGIQAHGLAEIFDKATTRNTNAAGEITDAISGAKLRSSIESFGTDKLKILLEPDDFNRLMKLRRVIEDVTIPISGTTNPSGSGNLIMRLIKDADNQFTAAASAAGFAVGGPAGAALAGGAARMISPAIQESRAAARAAQTAEDVTSYTPEKAAIDDTVGTKPVSAASKVAEKAKGAASSSVRAFIDTYGSPRIITPILAASQGDEE